MNKKIKVYCYACEMESEIPIEEFNNMDIECPKCHKIDFYGIKVKYNKESKSILINE